MTSDEADIAWLSASARRAGFGDLNLRPATDHSFTSGALRLHYLEWSGPGCPIVFLHGGRLTAHTWTLAALALSDAHRCIAMDLRGHGDSDWSTERAYHLHDFARDVSALVEHTQLSEYVLVGMSLGGKVGLTLAAEQPRGLKGLVVVDTGPNTQESGRTRLATFAAPREFASLDEAVEEALRFNPRRDRDGLRRSLLRNLRPTPDGTWSWKWDPSRVTSETLQQQRETEKRELTRAIPLIACPTLVVRGAESDVFSADDAQYLLSKLQHGKLVTIEGAGHTVQGDKPVELASAVRVFMHQTSC